MSRTVVVIGIVALLALPAATLTRAETLVGREWSRIWGSTNYDSGAHVEIDAAGNVYVAADTVGSFDGELYSGGGGVDSVISKWSPAGERIWTRIWGSNGCSDGWTHVAPVGTSCVYAVALLNSTNHHGPRLSKFDSDGVMA